MERKFQFSGKKGISRVKSNRRRPGCIRLFVCPTTGGRLEISVSPRETISGLKAALARKLRVSPGRITLIYKDKVLNDGCLLDHKIPDEGHVTLLPKMESGLSVHNTDKNIMQALENLTDTQIDDFLGGRAPLMLAIRIGDHMVFVQLQLSSLHNQEAAQNQCQSQQTGSAGVSPGAAHVLSQSGLSASALAQATRCLSHRLHMHRLQGDRLQGDHRVDTSRQSTSDNQVSQSTTPCNHPQDRLTATHPSSPSSLTPSSPTPFSTLLPHNTQCNTGHKTVPLCAPKSPSSLTSPCASLPKTLLQLQAPSIIPTVSSNSLPTPPPSPGAVIDSVKHEGKGVFTGTFSGSLETSLQDVDGSPKRNVNTILHILNDLLVAAPLSPAASPVANQSTPTMIPGSSSESQVFTFTSNTNLPLTPPCSPLTKTFPAPFPPKMDLNGSENEQLRSKMQRVQTMLAQRKEQRQKRRDKCGPYHVCKPPNKTQVFCASSTTLTKCEDKVYHTSSAVSKNSTSACHTESGSGETSCNYCMANIEQDTLAV